MALATLTIDIDARMASLEKDMGRAAQIAEDSAGRMKAVFTAAGVALGGLVAGFSIEGVKQFVIANAEAVDALNDVVDVTGSTIENISSLEQVALKTGATLDTVSTSLVKFNQVLNGAKAGSQIELDLTAIGLSVAELKALDPADAFIKTAQALSGFADDGTKARLIQELLGKSVKEIGPYLKDLAEKGKVNAEVTSDQAREAEKFVKHLAEMETRSKNTARAIAGELIPSLNKLFEKHENEGFLAMLGFDKGFFDTAKVGSAAAEFTKLNSLKESFEEGLRADPTNRSYQQRLAEVNVELVKAKANFKALYAASGAGGGKGAVNPELPSELPAIVEPPDAEALKKAAEEAKKAQEAYDKLIASIKEKVKSQQQEIDLGRSLTDAESFYLQSNKQIEEQTKNLTPALKASAQAFLERQRAVLLSNQAQIAGAAASARNAQTYLSEAEAARKTVEQLMFEYGLIGKTANQQEQLTRARARDVDQRQLDRAEALLALADSDAERETLTRLTETLREQMDVRDRLATRRDRDAQDVSAGGSVAFQNYVDNATKAGDRAAEAMTGGLQRTEDALVKFAETGKLEFADLFKFMAEEFLRQQARMAIAGAGSNVAGLLGSLGSAFLGGNTGIAASSASALPGDSLDNMLALTNNFSGRASGGPVAPNTMYEVNELGPELLEYGGKQFLMMGRQSGNVVPMKASGAQGGGGAGTGATGDVLVQVSVVVAPDGSATTQTNSDSGAAAKQLGASIATAVKAGIGQEMRPGGLLWKMKVGQA